MPLRLELEIFTYAKVIERTAVPEKSGRAVFLYNRKFCWNFLLYKKPDQAGVHALERQITGGESCKRDSFICVFQRSILKQKSVVLYWKNNEKPQQSKQNSS